MFKHIEKRIIIPWESLGDELEIVFVRLNKGYKAIINSSENKSCSRKKM